MTSFAKIEIQISIVSAASVFIDSAASITIVDYLDRDSELLGLVVNLAFRDRLGIFPIDRGRYRSLVTAQKKRMVVLKEVRSIT